MICSTISLVCCDMPGAVWLMFDPLTDIRPMLSFINGMIDNSYHVFFR